MTKAKGEKAFSSGVVTDEAGQLVVEINELARIRSALSYGTKTDIQHKAESTMSRKINSKVMQLSKLVMQHYDE